MTKDYTNTNTHECPVEGCRERGGKAKLMCRHHRFQVPKPLRDEIWSTWKGGKRLRWLAAVREAERFVNEEVRDAAA